MKYIRYVSNRSVKPAAHFDMDYSYIITDSQEINAVLDYIGMLELSEEITSMMVLVGEGDYDEIWVSFDSHPYYVTTQYHKIIHYYRS